VCSAVLCCVVLHLSHALAEDPSWRQLGGLVLGSSYGTSVGCENAICCVDSTVSDLNLFGWFFSSDCVCLGQLKLD
jgi:hypothetical protein